MKNNKFLGTDFGVQRVVLIFSFNSGLFCSFIGTVFAFVSASSFTGNKNIFTYLIEVFLSILLYPLLGVTVILYFWNNLANLVHIIHSVFKMHKIPYLRLLVTYISLIFTFIIALGIAPMFEDKNNPNNSLWITNKSGVLLILAFFLPHIFYFILTYYYKNEKSN